MPLTAHAITARKAEHISPTHRVSVEPYINTDSRFNKRQYGVFKNLPTIRRILNPRSCEMTRQSNQGKWQGQQGSNLRPAVLETAALPTELYPFFLRIFTSSGGPPKQFEDMALPLRRDETIGKSVFFFFPIEPATSHGTCPSAQICRTGEAAANATERMPPRLIALRESLSACASGISA